MPSLTLSEEDAHSRVAVLFVLSKLPDEKEPPMIAVSVKWLIENGVPINPETDEPMIYHGTFIIQ